jgi:hypothetical protein
MANKEEIIELIRLRGGARSTFNVGDKVLYDGAVAGGEYIVLCSVIEVTEDSVRVQELRTYYLNGGEFPERKISTISLSYFEKPIWEHILEGREVFKMIADAFEAENEKS